MIKVRKYKVRQNGALRNGKPTGYSASLPKEWVEDMGLEFGDPLNVYRDESDKLIFVSGKEV